ncbi:MAG: DUF4926 domain-containing protein [Flavobacteriaceae bacterium]|nr:DUF4926 domain-containing protein [Flavobacteriaceae bacterium]
MFKLYDVVKAKRRLSNDIPSGTLGTVVIIHDEFTSICYIVEFMNDKNETVGVLTVKESDLC